MAPYSGQSRTDGPSRSQVVGDWFRPEFGPKAYPELTFLSPSWTLYTPRSCKQLSTHRRIDDRHRRCSSYPLSPPMQKGLLITTSIRRSANARLGELSRHSMCRIERVIVRTFTASIGSCPSIFDPGLERATLNSDRSRMLGLCRIDSTQSIG